MGSSVGKNLACHHFAVQHFGFPGGSGIRPKRDATLCDWDMLFVGIVIARKKAVCICIRCPYVACVYSAWHTCSILASCASCNGEIPLVTCLTPSFIVNTQHELMRASPHSEQQLHQDSSRGSKREHITCHVPTDMPVKQCTFRGLG